MWFDKSKLTLPAPGEALPGRAERMPVPERHFVSGAPLDGPFPGMETAIFGPSNPPSHSQPSVPSNPTRRLAAARRLIRRRAA